MRSQLATPSALVPDVATRSVSDARALITTADRKATDVQWAVVEEQQFNDNVPTGIVIRQSPAGGVKLDDGGTIRLVVSKGPPLVALPQMDGNTVAAARAAILSAGFTVGKETPEAHETVPAGTVITWSVGGQARPGEAPKRSPVDLVVSSGPAPRQIPTLERIVEADARAKLEGLGLKTARTEAFSDTVAAGQVIGTNPGAGKSVRRGDTVTLIVSKGPDLVTVPTVLGRTYDEALTLLEQAGLQGGDVAGQGNRVRKTDPQPGTQVRRGTAVKITLGR
jgi:serine/threonine-protein kinase